MDLGHEELGWRNRVVYSLEEGEAGTAVDAIKISELSVRVAGGAEGDFSSLFYYNCPNPGCR